MPLCSLCADGLKCKWIFIRYIVAIHILGKFLTMDFSKYKKGTTSVWAGEDTISLSGATVVPVVNSVTFAYPDLYQWHDAAL